MLNVDIYFYDYMFHWANKCGGWVDTSWFDDYLTGKIKQRKEIELIERSEEDE